ncbi:NAD(P)-dependent oxidoreductase [Streptomyces sp. NPDC048385]|uniref:NAD(P)-dependent oxidoreductase n=1 Tax=Streptomyces sp. NPDC048385 TaxID=3155145 RepID=UPI00342C6F5E
MSGRETVGFVGLGSMGGVLASNLVRSGFDVVAYDALGPTRTPLGARWLPGPADMAQAAGTVVLSLPDGAASTEVFQDMAAAGDRRVTHVVDTSTIGVTTARALDAVAGLAYVDAPVSGGVTGARDRTLMVMYAGTDENCAHVRPVLEGLSDRHRRVGVRPGQAQALKLANNFLAATALAVTSEAVAFGQEAGLDMAVMLDVLNASSGRSAASADKFPAEILTGRYGAGFSNTLMAKDVRLYLREAGRLGSSATVAAVIEELWEEFSVEEPGADFTRIYPFVAGG